MKTKHDTVYKVFHEIDEKLYSFNSFWILRTWKVPLHTIKKWRQALLRHGQIRLYSPDKWHFFRTKQKGFSFSEKERALAYAKWVRVRTIGMESIYGELVTWECKAITCAPNDVFLLPHIAQRGFNVVLRDILLLSTRPPLGSVGVKSLKLVKKNILTYK